MAPMSATGSTTLWMHRLQPLARFRGTSQDTYQEVGRQRGRATCSRDRDRSPGQAS
jgi:hypothetical protein